MCRRRDPTTEEFRFATAPEQTRPSVNARGSNERSLQPLRFGVKLHRLLFSNPDGASDPFRPDRSAGEATRRQPGIRLTASDWLRLLDTVGTILLVCGEWMDGVGSLCYTQGGGKGMRLNLY